MRVIEDFGEFAGIEEAVAVAVFTRKTCAHCRMLEKELEAIDEAGSGIRLGKVEVETEDDLVGRFHIMSVPAILFLQRGELKEKLIGEYPKEIILDTARRVRN